MPDLNRTAEQLRDAVALLKSAAERMRAADQESPLQDRRIAKIRGHVEDCADAAEGLYQVLAKGAA